MKTRRVLTGVLSRRQNRVRSTRMFILFAFLIFPLYTHAQDLVIENPSLEGVPKGGSVPSPWIKAAFSPDVQPGNFGVSLQASQGNTYVGMLCNKDWAESISPKLSGKLKKGKTYLISFDLAYPSFYYTNVCNGSLEIFGGNTFSEKKEKLWSSGFFYNTEWKTYSAQFTPSEDYEFIMLGPYYDSTCTTAKMTGVLIDNFSPVIREVPQINVKVRNTCLGANTGAVSVDVHDGEGPYTYSWSPGNYTRPVIDNLKSGSYEVTVISANGTSAKKSVEVAAYKLEVNATITLPDCYGDLASINLNASGGIQPYVYSFDNGQTFESTSEIENVEAGNYNIVVRDTYGCTLKIDHLNIPAISPLLINSATVKPVSCSDVKNGKLILVASGGTPPYTYSIPGYKSQQDSIISQLDAGQYQYRITDSHNCSVDGDAVISKEWRDCAVFVPNAFSPNKDGLNDVFRAKINDDISSYRMAVYGRWGQLIFESSNPDMGWDGTQKGIDQPAGTYMYVITFTDSKKQPRKELGTVLLIK